jgi:hypothetical protein
MTITLLLLKSQVTGKDPSKKLDNGITRFLNKSIDASSKKLDN